MTLEELDKLALDQYEQGGDIWIECLDKHEKQAYLDQFGRNVKEEVLALFSLWNEHTEGIRNTAF